MKAVYYEEFKGDLQLVNLRDPIPKPDGVIIKVMATGLCLSDWHGWMGHDQDITLPHVPGHELAGEIVEIGRDVKKLKKGDRVTLPFVGGCGKCEQCQNNNHQICDHQFQPGFTHWGSFAEYVSIHYADTNVVKLPDEIGYATAASLGCRFATSFRAVVDQGKISPGQWVAVYGCGGVGLSAIMIARAKGANVIAVDVQKNALNHALSLGANYVINSSESEDVPETIISLSKGGVHVSIDALGHPEILFNSVSSLRKRGKHIQVGIMKPQDKYAKIPTDLIIARELEIIGSHGMQAFRYSDMIKMILKGDLHPDKLISENITLEKTLTALPKMPFTTESGIKVIMMEK